MDRKINNRVFWWTAFFLFLVVTLSSLDFPMVVNAAKYAQIAREIINSGEWINLTIAGEPYIQKPPLLFWTGAVFFKLFGISTPVWKMAVLLFSFLGIFSTYQLGKLLYGEAAGKLSALFWVCSLGFLYFHNDIHTDTLLADTVLFSIWQLALFYEKGKKRHFLLGVAGAGLAMLAKGPVGLAIPLTSVLTHLMVHKRWKEIFHPRWVVAFLIITLLLSPVLLGLVSNYGMEGLKFFFWTNNVGRITGSYYSQHGDPVFFLHTLLSLSAPFSVFVVAGTIIFFRATISDLKKRSRPGEFYTAGGIFPYFLVLSISQTQNPHYLLPVIPLFMILAARYVMLISTERGSLAEKKTVSVFNIIIISLFWIVTALFVFWLFPEKNPVYWLSVSAFAGLFFYFFRTCQGIQRHIACLTITIFAFMFSMNTSFIPHMKTYHSPLQAVEVFNNSASPSEKIHIYREKARYWDIFWYSKNPGTYYATDLNIEKLLECHKDWVFTDDEGKNQILKKLPLTRVAGEFHHRSLSGIRLTYLNPATRSSTLKKMYLLQLP